MSSVPSFGSLEGLKIIDLTLMLAGPFATQVLADQGANVIKVEPPHGDLTRSASAFHVDDTMKTHCGYFQSVNRNKRSVVLDLKTEDGCAIIKKLIADTDVVVENFRAGVMDRLGLSYETLREINPKLVYASVRGFGDPRTAKSPYMEWPAFDVVAQAMGGIMGITGPNAETPTKVGPGVGDIVPALFCTIGVLSAVLKARETGQGQYVDVAMVDSILSICERMVHQYSFEGKLAEPEGNHHPFLAPFGMFPAKDGWVSIGCPNNAFWKILAEKLGLEHLQDDPRFKTPNARSENRKDVIQIVSAATAQQTKAGLKALLGGAIPFGPVYDMNDIADDPHFAAREMVVEIENPGLDHPMQVAGVPIRMTETPGGVHTRAPHLGEHTDEVLSAAGFDGAQIDAWRQAGVIK
jgi:crotonobetainyl-CoA:carnitine CoA-transferase CaiB-like acyl-CoA transferase